MIDEFFVIFEPQSKVQNQKVEISGFLPSVAHKKWLNRILGHYFCQNFANLRWNNLNIVRRATPAHKCEKGAPKGAPARTTKTRRARPPKGAPVRDFIAHLATLTPTVVGTWFTSTVDAFFVMLICDVIFLTLLFLRHKQKCLSRTKEILLS